MKKVIALQVRHVTLLFAYLLIVWGFYRLLFQVPEPFDELLVKPVVWLVPVLIFLKKEKLGLNSIGITNKNLFPAIYFSLVLGALFAFEGFFINYFKYKGSLFSANIGEYDLYFALLLSVITGISEELTFRGYFYTRLVNILKNEWKATLITSAGWTMIHLPIALFDWKLDLSALSIYLLLIFIFGFGASFIYARTRNVIAPILLHVMWAWPILLFR